MSVLIEGGTGWTSVPNTIGRSRLPHSTVHLILNLLSHADGFKASYKIIGQQTGMAPATIASALDNLKKLGLVEVRKNPSHNGENPSNMYVFKPAVLWSLTPEFVDETLRKIEPENDASHFNNQSDPTSKTEATPLQNLKRPHFKNRSAKKTRSKRPGLEDHKDMLNSSESSVNDSPAEVEAAPANKYPADFLAWYEIYPRKKAKGDALKAYRQALKDISHDDLIARTREFARHVTTTGTAQQFIPYPATWLRGAQWDDELEPAHNAVSGAQSTPPRGRAAEALLVEQWAREDAENPHPHFAHHTNNVFEWPTNAQREISQ